MGHATAFLVSWPQPSDKEYTQRGVTSLSQLLGLLVSFFQIGSITGAILIVLIAVVGGILYQSAWIITPNLWIVGTIFPVAGYSLGFFLARIAGQPWYRCRTVALETGMQNTQLCSTIVQLSFTQEQLNQVFTFPLIYSIFQLAFAAMFLGLYVAYKKCYGKNNEEFPEIRQWNSLRVIAL